MDQRQFFLRDILTIVFKHKLLIVTFPMLVFVAVFAGNCVWPPTYESSAKIRLTRGREVSQTDPTVMKTSQNITTISMGIEDINSEIELILSRDLVAAVVDELQLQENPKFPYGDGVFQRPYRHARRLVARAFEALRLTAAPSQRDRAMEQLEEAIYAQPVRDSWILQVTCRTGDPELAQRILGTLLTQYRKLHVEVFRNPQTKDFFQEQLDRVEATLLTAQRALDAFRVANRVSLLDTEKELLLIDYTAAQRILTQLSLSESVIAGEDLDSPLISSLASQSESTVVREMQLRLFELLLEQSRVVQTLGPRHPTVISLEEQIRKSQQQLADAIATTKRITENKLAKVEARLLELNGLVSEMNKKEQEVTILLDNYAYYAQKLEESRVADNLANAQVDNIRIAEKPSLPRNPIHPKKLLNLVLALVGGIVSALALAFFLDYLDHGLKTPEDVDHYLGVPALASFFNKPGEALFAREAERLATLIDTAHAEGEARIVQVNSSIAREGAGQVAEALAEAFAKNPEAGVLLVDFANETKRAGKAPKGLTDLVLEEATIDEVLEIEANLAVIGRGSHTESLAYLWGSERMERLMADLRGRFSYIILHVGPILQSQDAIKLSRYADSIVLIVKSDSTRREIAIRALDMFKGAENKVLGAVLTERTQRIPQLVYRRI